MSEEEQEQKKKKKKKKQLTVLETEKVESELLPELVKALNELEKEKNMWRFKFTLNARVR